MGTLNESVEMQTLQTGAHSFKTLVLIYLARAQCIAQSLHNRLHRNRKFVESSSIISCQLLSSHTPLNKSSHLYSKTSQNSLAAHIFLLWLLVELRTWLWRPKLLMRQTYSHPIPRLDAFVVHIWELIPFSFLTSRHSIKKPKNQETNKADKLEKGQKTILPTITDRLIWLTRTDPELW